MTYLKSANPAPELDNLLFGERLLLWGIRLWVAGYRDGENVQEILRHGFKLAGLSQVHFALDDLMHLIATSATEPVDIRCPKCVGTSADEHLLLGVIAAWQEGRGKDQGTALLSTWLPMAAVRFAQPAASAIARAMADRGLPIRSRCRRLASSAQKSLAMYGAEISPTRH
ncbi:MAG: hypothetical protein HQ483_03655 [Rhodospirillales bacterium]|nr:hypothetical protein [Rhodospirillales bacterium]